MSCQQSQAHFIVINYQRITDGGRPLTWGCWTFSFLLTELPWINNPNWWQFIIFMRRSLLASFTTVFRYNMRQYSKDVLVLWSGWWTEYFMVKWLRNRKAVVNIKDHSLICSESTTPLKEKKIQKREVCVTYECRDAHTSGLHFTASPKRLSGLQSRIP